MISFENLHKQFGSNKVLDGVSGSVKQGESFVIIGGSGTGKSVLIKCLLGILTPDMGKIHIKQNIKLGILFQGSALFDSMTVLDNVAFGLVQGQGMNKQKARDIALEKLISVDLSKDIAKIFPSELSGGMQKRVALARAIATSPDVIFFDEPTTGLDPIISSTINDLIIKIVKEIGATAITITHDIQSLRKIGDKVSLLVKGKFVWSGEVAKIDQDQDPYLHQFINGLSEGPCSNN